MSKYALTIFRYALAVCRNHEGKYLCVKENMNKGWWIPGGKVLPGQTFRKAVIRECLQQTGIDAQVKGIIRVDTGKFIEQDIVRCIYYMQPLQRDQVPKRKADFQSQRAQFLDIKQILTIKSEWRSPEIYEFPKYLEDGGTIFPQQIFIENYNS